MSDEKRADDEAIRRQAEIGVSVNALTGPDPLQGPSEVESDVGSSIPPQAIQLPARDVEQLVSADGIAESRTGRASL